MQQQASKIQFSRGRRVNLWLVICCMLLWWGSAPRAAHADFIPNHIYVYYDANHIPQTSGSLEDITLSSHLNSDEHLYDLYGNEMIPNYSNHLIYDLNSNVVGFIYQ